MYTTKTPQYVIDLQTPEEKRWKEVIKKDKGPARRVARAALAEIEESSFSWLRTPGGWLLEKVYGIHGGRYQGEIADWARALNVSVGDATLLNCTYELSHLYDLSIFGCTAGARWIKGIGMVHVRSMDWPIKAIGSATRLVRFRNRDHEFIAVGILGYVGVLSGMVPGAYSVTINWAPPDGLPTFDFGPAFLLREVLGEAATYEEAVYSLRHTPVSTPVFYLVCGAQKGQACVIERGKKSAAVRKLTDEVIVQANHHEARKFLGQNDSMDEGAIYVGADDTALDDSIERAEALVRSLSAAGKAKNLVEAARALKPWPVTNDDSYQQMAFCPTTGEVKVWRWI